MINIIDHILPGVSIISLLYMLVFCYYAFMFEKHFEGKIAQKVIIEHGDHFLVARGIGDTVWEFPGGRLNEGEEPIEGVCREIMEELGLALKDIKPIWIGRSLHEKTNIWRVLVAYHALSETDTCTVDPNEVEEIKWISRSALETLSMFKDCRNAADVFLATNKY